MPSLGLARTFWLPSAVLVATEIYASGFDGWGAWATAPLFLLPFGLSLAIGGAGIVLCIQDFRASRLHASSLIFTVIAALPLLWLLIRRHVA